MGRKRTNEARARVCEAFLVEVVAQERREYIWDTPIEGERAREPRGAHPGSPWLALLAR
jgi:hypothetical protein